MSLLTGSVDLQIAETELVQRFTNGAAMRLVNQL
jgi:hypothetical protein